MLGLFDLGHGPPRRREPGHEVGVRPGVVVHRVEREVVVVVRRHEHPVGVPGAAGQRLPGLLEVGELGVADLHHAGQRVALLVDVAHARLGSGFPRHHLHAVAGLHGVERRHVPGVEEPTPPGAVVGVGEVQGGEVGGVGAVLDEVVPVVVVVARRLDAPLAAGLCERCVLRQRRLLVRRPEVGEDQPAQLPHRVGEVAHLLVERAAGRLRRLLQAGAGHVEEPPVVRAAQPRCHHVAVLQGGAAVGAVKPQEPQAALAVAEQHQVLAEDAHPDGDVPQVVVPAHHHPVAPEPLAGGRAPAHMGEVTRRECCHAGFLPRVYPSFPRTASVIPANRPCQNSPWLRTWRRRPIPSFRRKPESRGGRGKWE